jgi:prepilin-type N-terminal cleavage/methylation domain-containing protein
MNGKRMDRGVTLLELSITIAVLILLASIVTLSVKPFYAYRDGRAAGEALRSVKTAMQLYLADNPSAQVSSLTSALLAPYLPGQAMPALPLVNGTAPTIRITSFPPVAILNGNPYDPSGSPTDGLWDAGP